MMRDHPLTSLGTCCLCGKEGATVLVLLAARSPLPGKGWGCLTCGLSDNGALAVLCPPCAEAHEQPGQPSVELALRWACRGYPAQDGRIPFDELRGEHRHIRRHHPEVGPAGSMAVLPADTRWPTHVEEGRGALCSRCGQTIHEGVVAIRAWPESGQWALRYHPVCFGAMSNDSEDPYASTEEILDWEE